MAIRTVVVFICLINIWELKNAEVMLIFFHKCNECNDKRSAVKESCVEESHLFPCILGKPTQVREKSRRKELQDNVRKIHYKYNNVQYCSYYEQCV